MSYALTAEFEFRLPDVGDDIDQWGDDLNYTIQRIENEILTATADRDMAGFDFANVGLINNLEIITSLSTAHLSIAGGKTLTVSNTVTLNSAAGGKTLNINNTMQLNTKDNDDSGYVYYMPGSSADIMSVDTQQSVTGLKNFQYGKLYMQQNGGSNTIRFTYEGTNAGYLKVPDVGGSGAEFFIVGETQTQNLTNKTYNKVTITEPATAATLTLVNGTTLYIAKTFQFTGSDGSIYNFPGSNGGTYTLTKTTDKLSVFAATSSAELAGVISDETGTGKLVFNTDPVFTSLFNIESTDTFGSATFTIYSAAGAYELDIYSDQDSKVKLSNNNVLNMTMGSFVVDSGENATVTSGNTTIVVTDSAPFYVGQVVKINNTIFRISAIPDGTHITVIYYTTPAFSGTYDIFVADYIFKIDAYENVGGIIPFKIDTYGNGIFSKNVGVGNDPISKLTVYGTASTASITSGAGQTEIFTIWTSATTQMTFGGEGSTPYSMWIQTRDESGSGNFFPLSLNPLGGYVGIGKLNPDVNLHIYDSANYPALYIDDGTVQVELQVHSGSDYGFVGTKTNHDFLFYVDNAERMRIKTTGEIDISAAESGAYGFTINGPGAGTYNHITFRNSSATSPYSPTSDMWDMYLDGANNTAQDLIFQIGISPYPDVLRLTNLTSVILGKAAALATTDTDGFVYIPTCAGTPTGTPTAYTGKVPLVYDTTNNKLYAYNGAWKSVTLS